MLLLAVLQAVVVPAEIVPADIVVVARERRCDVAIANRVISGREFRARAKEWAAGVPVRVHVPTHADLRCMSRIAFRLADEGVRRIEFVEPGRD